MHAIPITPLEYFAIFTDACFHPISLPHKVELIIPYVEEVVFINIPLGVMIINIGTSRD
jgi:hypothetical protein